MIRQKRKEWNSYMFNFIKYFIISWFAVNFLNFLNFKAFSVILNIHLPFFPLILSILLAVLPALFVTYYSFQIQKILNIQKGNKVFGLKSSISLFIKELTSFEKTMYLFLNFLVLIFLETLSATASMYIDILLGIGTSIFFYFFLLYLSFIFLIKIFKSQRFIAYKMGINL